MGRPPTRHVHAGWCPKCAIRPSHPSHNSRWCRECLRANLKDRHADFRIPPQRLGPDTVVCVTQEGRYYTHRKTPRRCRHCACFISAFRDSFYCRPCIRAGRGYDTKHVVRTVRELMWRTGRRMASTRYRLGDMQRQDTHAPAWVHPMADALEQWETYCEEIAR